MKNKIDNDPLIKMGNEIVKDFCEFMRDKYYWKLNIDAETRVHISSNTLDVIFRFKSEEENYGI